MTKAFLTELRELDAMHAAHKANVLRLQQRLPTLTGENADRARSTIQNLQSQMLRIDVLLLRAECDKEV